MEKNKFCKNCKQYAQFFHKAMFNYFPERYGFCNIRKCVQGEKDRCDLLEVSNKPEVTISEIDDALKAVKFLMKIYKYDN